MSLIGLFVSIAFMAVEDSQGSKPEGCGHMVLAVFILTGCVISDFLFFVS